MSSLDKAVNTQLTNIQAKTGKTLDELSELINKSGLVKHSEIRQMLQNQLGLGYGDANALVHYALKSDGERTAQAAEMSTEDVLDTIYTGAKANLRPIHDRLMDAIQTFGDFEIVPKKGYVSLRRKKQFTMIGPATNTRIEVGLNIKTLEASPRLAANPPGSMCNYTVRITKLDDVDAELVSWIRQAFENAA